MLYINLYKMSNYIVNISEILGKTGWPQTQLAKQLGVTFATVNRWLNRHTRPHPGQLQRIERLYKSTVGIAPLSSKEIVEMIQHVGNKKKQFPDIRQLFKNKDIMGKLLLELTYHSDAIGGNRLSKKETHAVIFNKATIKDKSLIEHLEAVNHAAIFKQIFSGKIKGKIGETLIKKLHAGLMHGISDDRSEYAKSSRTLQGVDLALPRPESIPEEIMQFCRKINRFESHPVIHITKMHADFEAIQPFSDGNGRIGRLLMNIQLIENGFAPCMISVNEKDKYYEYLGYAQKKSESHLICFIAEAILKGYGIIEKFR